MIEIDVLRTAAQEKARLMDDEAAYIESIGKQDINTLLEVAGRPYSQGTVLRLVLGATEAMPHRALSYIATAVRCADLIGSQQVQIVHAVHLGMAINRLDLAQTTEQVTRLTTLARVMIAEAFPEVESKVLHGLDSPVDLTTARELSQEVFDTNVALRDKLMAKGAKRNADAISYTAAHFVFQDTDMLELQTPFGSTDAQIAAERIISIGCQQERIFYKARMAMRQQATATGQDFQMIDTAQLFTRHVSPPYYIARGGEPLLGEFVSLDEVGDLAARRDLAHFTEIIDRKRTTL